MPLDYNIPLGVKGARLPDFLGKYNKAVQTQNTLANMGRADRREQRTIEDRNTLKGMSQQQQADKIRQEQAQLSARWGTLPPQQKMREWPQFKNHWTQRFGPDEEMLNSMDYSPSLDNRFKSMAMDLPFKGGQAGAGAPRYSINKPLSSIGPDGKLKYHQQSTAGGTRQIQLPTGHTPLAPELDWLDKKNEFVGVDPITRQIVKRVAKGVSPEQEPEFKKKQAAAVIEAGVEAGTTVPKAETIKIAKKKVTSELVRMKDSYEKLRELGGIVDLEGTGWSNLGARISSSDIGQGAQNSWGSKSQSIRNEIKAMKPTLINAVRQATNMGAKGMDSEKELEFYLQTVTNEKRDFQSNMAAIAALDRAYGLNIGFEIDPALQKKLDALDKEFKTKTAPKTLSKDDDDLLRKYGVD